MYEILLVEDDVDSAEMLRLMLEGAGYRVALADGPLAALERLRQRPVDLLLTDYDMPGMTGATLLRQAIAERLLRANTAIVITAHPSPTGIEGVPLVTKPVHHDKLLEQVRRILLSQPEPPVAATTVGPRLELVLCVAPNSLASAVAQRNAAAILEDFDPRQVKYEVCNVADDPVLADVLRITFTPTLVKASPAPAVWVLGDLSQRDLLVELLETAGVRRVRGVPGQGAGRAI